MKRSLMIGFAALAVAALVGGTAIGNAADDPIGMRKEIMKKVGGAAKYGSQVGKGEAEYDAAKAEAAMADVKAAGEAFSNEFAKYFPAPPAATDDTTAAPKIWEASDEFKKYAAKLAEDAGAAIEPAKKDKDSFLAAFGNVMKNCKGCHEEFRVKKE